MEAILKNHGIDTKIINGSLHAMDEWSKEGAMFSNWINVSNWTMTELYNWLGY